MFTEAFLDDFISVYVALLGDRATIRIGGCLDTGVTQEAAKQSHTPLAREHTAKAGLGWSRYTQLDGTVLIAHFK